MGTQKPVKKFELDDLEKLQGEAILGGPIAEHHGKKKSKSKIKEEVKEKKFKKEEEKKASAPAEKQEAKSAEEAEKPKKKQKQAKAKVRSKNYQKVLSLIDRTKKYDVAEAINLAKKTSLSKFDGNVEVHIRLMGKSGKPEQARGLLQYPHPTGKKINLAILDEKLIEDIEKTGKEPAAFRHSIYLATPALMPKVARLAKILGPKGKMPNPKAGTITENPEKTKKEHEAGQVEYKTDSYGIVHQVIGKISADNKILEENLRALLAVLPEEKIVSITLCATMGPGIKVLTK